MKIQVITKIPDVDRNDGNLCNEIFVGDCDKSEKNIFFRPFKNIIENINKVKIPVQLEVFSLGEIIIVDNNEREIGGIQRKASKWFVGYKLFELDEINKAIKLSKNLIKNL